VRDSYFDEQTRKLFEQDKLSEVVSYCTSLLPELRAARGDQHPDVGRALSEMARAYYYLGNYQASLETNKEALKINCASAERVTAECIRSLSNLALDYRLTGRIAEAELAYERAFELMEKLAPGEEWDRATTLLGRAQVHDIKEEFADAERLLFDALRMRIRAYGWCSPNVAIVFDNLGGVYRQMGKMLAAERAIRKAIRMYRACDSAETVNCGMAIRSLARMLARQSQLSEAKALANEALDIHRRVCPLGHPETTKSERLVEELAKR
jgi:tetratricopeptide (TPR) repeat protein